MNSRARRLRRINDNVDRVFASRIQFSALGGAFKPSSPKRACVSSHYPSVLLSFISVLHPTFTLLG